MRNLVFIIACMLCGCSASNNYLVQGAKIIDLDYSNYRKLHKQKLGEYLAEGKQSVILIESSNIGRWLVVDDETFKRLIIVIPPEQQIFSKLKIDAEQLEILYFSGAWSWADKRIRFLSSHPSGYIEFVNVSKDSISIDIRLTLNTVLKTFNSEIIGTEVYNRRVKLTTVLFEEFAVTDK